MSVAIATIARDILIMVIGVIAYEVGKALGDR